MRRLLVVLPAVLCLASPAGALAAARDVIRDCTDNGRIDSYHSQGDYSSALGNLPSDVDEYTDCRQIIGAAKRRDARRPPPAGGGGGGGGGFGSFDGGTPPAALNVPQTPAERSAIASAARGGGAPVTVAGEPIVPGGSGIVEAAVRHALPGPLLAVLLLMGLGTVATLGAGARARGNRPPTWAQGLFDRVFPRRS